MIRRGIAPCDTGPQPMHHTSECHSVRNAQPPGVAMAALGSRRQHEATRFHGASGTRSARILDALPTKIVERNPRTQPILNRSVSDHGPGELGERVEVVLP